MLKKRFMIMIGIILMSIAGQSIAQSHYVDLRAKGRLVLHFADEDSSAKLFSEQDKAILQALKAGRYPVWLTPHYSSAKYRTRNGKKITEHESDLLNMQLGDGRARLLADYFGDLATTNDAVLGARVLFVDWGKNPYAKELSRVAELGELYYADEQLDDAPIDFNITDASAAKKLFISLGGLYLYSDATRQIGFAVLSIGFQEPYLGLRVSVRGGATNVNYDKWSPATLATLSLGYKDAVFVEGGAAWVLNPHSDGYLDRESSLMLGTSPRIVGKLHLDLAAGVSQRNQRQSDGSYKTFKREPAGRAGLSLVF